MQPERRLDYPSPACTQTHIHKHTYRNGFTFTHTHTHTHPFAHARFTIITTMYLTNNCFFAHIYQSHVLF